LRIFILLQKYLDMPNSKALALNQLEQLQIPFTSDSFIAQVRAGNSEAVGLFLKAGMSPDTSISRYYVPGDPPQNHNPAILIAAETGHVEIVKLMLEAHSKLVGEVFVTASALGHAELVKELIRLGVNKHPYHVYDAMAMYAAAGNNQAEIIRLLVESGVNVDVTSRKIINGRTALMEATLEENVELIEYLIRAGANVNLEDAQGVTALDIAIQKGHIEIVNLLTENSFRDSIL
jgi:ankyrin repeat protein